MEISEQLGIEDLLENIRLKYLTTDIIARALIARPQIIIDEPTGALDSKPLKTLCVYFEKLIKSIKLY